MTMETRRQFLSTLGASCLASGLLDSVPMIAEESQTARSATEGFQPIEPPEWVGQISRMSYLTPDAVPDVAKIGVQVVHGNAVWPYFPLRKDGGGLSESDRLLLKRFTDTAHQHGMKLVLGLPPFPSVDAMLAHPEWRIQPGGNEFTQPTPLEDNLGTRLACNNGPWGEYLIEVCAELMEDFGLDGYSFDGNYHPPICHCVACREAWRSFAGEELPESANLEELSYRRYLVWRGERLENHYSRMQKRLKGIRPDAVIMTWTVNAGRYGHFLHSPRAMPTRMNLLIDLPMQEWWLDETNFGGSIAPWFGAEYLAAVTGYRYCGCEPYLMSRGNPYSPDSFPAQERMIRSLGVLAHGSTTAHSVGWTWGVAGAEPVFSETKIREPWILNAKPIPWAGILVSEQTRQFFAWKDIAERFLPHVFGMYRTAMEEHLPVSLLNDWDITDDGLRPYRVVVLPNSAALSESQLSALRRFVAAGGGLVATAEASLCDELGVARNDFGLSEEFGVSYAGKSSSAVNPSELDENFARSLNDEYWRNRVGAGVLTLMPDSPLINQPVRELIPSLNARFKGPSIRVTEPEVSSDIHARFRIDGEPGIPDQPAAILRHSGQGRVAYFPLAVDAAMWSYSYPFLREMLANGIRWAAGEPPQIKIRAPRCVQVTFKTRLNSDGVSETILHFFNNVNSTAHAGLPANDVPLRDETIAIHGIEVHVSTQYKALLTSSKARIQPGDRAVESVLEDGELIYRLPPLEIHFMLVLE
ncbi:MAG: hypothetical protein JNL58_29345 [Planctomyces sp.]|nr:hypothetical protein [Planctomyces sp.]